MATANVIVSTCDRCGTEVEERMTRLRRGTLDLPSGWIHIAANSQTSLVFEMDLCTECKQNVLQAAGKAEKGRRRPLSVVS